MKRKTLYMFVGVWAGIVLFLLYSQVSLGIFGAVISPFPTTCSIGVTGTAANVTLTGVGANYACEKVSSQSTMLYRMQEAPQGNEMCEGDLQQNGFSLHYVVRDTGMLNLVGGALCAKLRQGETQFTTANPTPTPTEAPSTVSTSCGPSNTATIYDSIGALNTAQIQRATASFPTHIAIYVVNNASETNATFDQTAKNSLNGNDHIVIAFNTHHIAIVGDTTANLSQAQYTQAVKVFIANISANHNYTTATLAAIQSLKVSFGCTNM